MPASRLTGWRLRTDVVVPARAATPTATLGVIDPWRLAVRRAAAEPTGVDRVGLASVAPGGVRRVG